MKDVIILTSNALGELRGRAKLQHRSGLYFNCYTVMLEYREVIKSDQQNFKRLVAGNVVKRSGKQIQAFRY